MAVLLGPSIPHSLEALIRTHGPGNLYVSIRLKGDKRMERSWVTNHWKFDTALWSLGSEMGTLLLEHGDGANWADLGCTKGWIAVDEIEGYETVTCSHCTLGGAFP